MGMSTSRTMVSMRSRAAGLATMMSLLVRSSGMTWLSVAGPTPSPALAEVAGVVWAWAPRRRTDGRAGVAGALLVLPDDSVSCWMVAATSSALAYWTWITWMLDAVEGTSSWLTTRCRRRTLLARSFTMMVSGG